MLIKEIYPLLKEKYNITYDELERIIDSQFKCSQLHIESKTTKTIKWANLGKIKPSLYLIKNHGELSKKV
jgi:hypothetical protein